MTAAADWVSAKATLDTAIAGLATANVALASAQAAYTTTKGVLEALVDDDHPLKVYNTTGTTYVAVMRVGGSVVIQAVTM